VLSPGTLHNTFEIGTNENPQGGIATNTNGLSFGFTNRQIDGADDMDAVLGIEAVNPPPEPGLQTQQMKVLEESYSANGLTLLLEAGGGSIQEIPLRFNSASRPHLKVNGASLQENILRITFPAGSGYQKQKVLINPFLRNPASVLLS
jgi:hypothetical protein